MRCEPTRWISPVSRNRSSSACRDPFPRKASDVENCGSDQHDVYGGAEIRLRENQCDANENRSNCRENISQEIVLAKFHFPAVLPDKNDPFGVHDLQFARHKTSVAKFLLGHLPFADTGLDVRPKRHRAARHMFVTGDLHGDHFVALLGDPHDLVVMPAIMPDPFAVEVDGLVRVRRSL